MKFAQGNAEVGMKPSTIKCALNILVLLLMHLANALTLDVKRQNEHFTPDYNIYHNLTSIQSFIEKFCEDNKNFVHLVEPDTYVSKNGRKQYVLRIRNYLIGDDTKFVKILLSFGEHAREFLPVETMFYMLEKMMQSFRSGILDIDLNKIELYIVVISNPDGRFHVEKTKNYCWRGTSTGVDINRNFEWEFGGKGSSSDPLDEEYRGPKPFSEPETNIYRHLTELVQFDGFLSLHSGVKQIYIPYADSVSQRTRRLPDNIEEMRKLAQLLSTSTVHIYRYGGASILNGYTADGTVFDYMAGIRKIPFSYAIELWGTKDHKGPSCFDLFNPPNEKLKTVISEIYPMYVAFFNYILEWKNRTMQIHVQSQSVEVDGQIKQDDGSVLPYEPKSSRTKQLKRTEALQVEMPSITPGFILLCIVVIVTVVLGFTGKYPVCRRWYQRRRVVNLRALSSTLSFNLFST